jgi:Protein of unknown function DUF2625
MRSIEELMSVDSSWPHVLNLLESSPYEYEVVPAPLTQRESTLLSLQVSVHSVMGALAWNCGLVAIDSGWVRLVGAGFGSLDGLHIEKLRHPASASDFEGIVVAHDVLGGQFVVHGSGLEADAGEILYWAPDSLDWSRLGMGHADLVTFLLSGGVSEFYRDLRWEGWQASVRDIDFDHGLSAYPFPWTEEGQRPDVTRRAVPMRELVAFAFDAAERLRS